MTRGAKGAPIGASTSKLQFMRGTGGANTKYETT